MNVNSNPTVTLEGNDALVAFTNHDEDEYSLRFQRIGENNVRVNLQTFNSDNIKMIGGYEHIKIKDLTTRLISKRSPIVLDILGVFEVDSLDPKMSAMLRNICGQVQRKWEKTYYRIHEGMDESTNPPIHTRDHIIKAEKLLLNKNVLEYILREQEKLDMVGEENNRGFLTLSAIQAYTKKFTDIDGVGISGSGKSKTQDTVLACMPPEHIVTAMRISKRSPERMFDMLSKAYIFRIMENRGAQASSETFRNSNMDDMGGDVYVVKDGELEHLKMPPISKWGTQVSFEKQDEDDTRGLKYIPDGSTKQTRLILNRVGEDSTISPEFKKALGHTNAVFDPIPIQIAIRRLKKNKDGEIDFLIPYGERISKFLDANKVRARRDMKKLIGMIWASATLHQYQRKCINIKDMKFILADVQDIKLAFKYSATQSNMTYIGTSPADAILIDIIREMEDEWKERQTSDSSEYDGAISDHIIEKVRKHPELGFQKTWTTRQLKYLSEKSLITSEFKNTSVFQRYRNYYKAIDVKDMSFMKNIDYNILIKENERMKKIYVKDWNVTIEDNPLVSEVE